MLSHESHWAYQVSAGYSKVVRHSAQPLTALVYIHLHSLVLGHSRTLSPSAGADAAVRAKRPRKVCGLCLAVYLHNLRSPDINSRPSASRCFQPLQASLSIITCQVPKDPLPETVISFFSVLAAIHAHRQTKQHIQIIQLRTRWLPLEHMFCNPDMI